MTRHYAPGSCGRVISEITGRGCWNVDFNTVALLSSLLYAISTVCHKDYIPSIIHKSTSRRVFPVLHKGLAQYSHRLLLKTEYSVLNFDMYHFFGQKVKHFWHSEIESLRDDIFTVQNRQLVDLSHKKSFQ